MEQRQFEGGYYEVERGHAFYDSIRRDLNESKNIEFSLHGETGESYFLKNEPVINLKKKGKSVSVKGLREIKMGELFKIINNKKIKW